MKEEGIKEIIGEIVEPVKGAAFGLIRIVIREKSGAIIYAYTSKIWPSFVPGNKVKANIIESRTYKPPEETGIKETLIYIHWFDIIRDRNG